MPPLRLGGLSSGLDTETLIAQLLAAESGGKVRYQRQLDVAEARKSTLADISSKLKALGSALADLRSPTLFAESQTVESSDPARIAVTRTGSVGTGAYAIAVTQVAAAQQRRYTYVVPPEASGLTVGGHTTAIAAGASREDAISAINSDPDAKVWASALGTGELVLSWRKTGDDWNADTVTSSALTDEDVTFRPGKDAAFTIDGGPPQSSASNEITDKIAGLSFTIKSTTTADVSITVGAPGPDLQRVTDKVKAFVDAYNAANDLIRNELREDKVRGANTKFDRGRGVLRGDAQLSALQGALRQALQTTSGSNAAADQLADLGITTGAAAGAGTFSRDAVNGKLVLDETKLKATLQAQPAAAKALLGGTGDGIAQALEAVLAPATGADGSFDARTKSADAEMTRLRASMTAFDERLSLRERSLRAMFTRLEQNLAASQQQGSQLSARLAQL
jgi:flagellar hook-associated protein 2